MPQTGTDGAKLHVWFETRKDCEAFVAEHYHPDWEVIQRYERKKLTTHLAWILDNVAEDSYDFLPELLF